MIRSGGKNRKDKNNQEQQQPAQQQQTAQNTKQDKEAQQQQAAKLDNPPTAAVAAAGTPDHALKEITNTQDDVNTEDAGSQPQVLSTPAPLPAAQATSEPVSAVSAEGEQDIKPMPSPVNPVTANSAEASCMPLPSIKPQSIQPDQTNSPRSHSARPALRCICPSKRRHRFHYR